MSRYNEKEKRTLTIYSFIFFLLAAGISISGTISYRNFEQQFRVQAGLQLSSIAELKMNELVDWRRGRLADANMLYQNHAFATLTQAYFENPKNLEAESQLQDWLKNYQENSEYSHVRLIDPKGEVHLSFPIGLQSISSDVADHIPEVLQSKQMVLFDFYRTDTNQTVRLSLLVPIMDVQTGSQVIGLVAISIDPEVYLFPFIEDWPIESTTAETLLIRREGNDAVFLNNLRFDPEAALTLRFPLTDTELPSVKAALGQTGIVQGLDYRGKQVLADVRAVPESPWFLVSKMDIAEVDGPLTARLWQTFFLAGLAIFAMGAGLMTVWRQQRVEFYRTQADAAEAVRESEKKYRALVENMQVGVVVHAPDTRILLSNPMASELLGLTPDQMQGKTAIDPAWCFIREDGTRASLEEYPVNRALASQAPISNLILGILRPDRESPTWAQCDAHQDYDSNGTLQQIVVTFFDITERKHVEDALQASELRFRSASENLIDIIYEWDLKDRVDWFGDIDRMMGFPNGEFPRTMSGWAEMLHPQDRSVVLEAVDAQLKHAIPYIVEYRVRKLDDSWRWWSARGTVLRDEHGQPTRWIGSVTDITGRKRVADALQRSERKYRQLHESMMDGFVSVDMDGKFLECNEIYRNMLGYTEAELLHLTYIELTPEKWHAYEKDVVQDQVMKRGYSDVYEKEYCRKDGTIFPVELHTVLSRDEYGKLSNMWAIVRDITERKLAEQQLAEYAGHLEEEVNQRTRELRQAQELLVRQERLATLGQLAGSMGHELRNPLGVISNAIYFLKAAQPDANDKVKEYLNMIEKEARTSNKIITDLLDFTRLKSVEREAVSVSDMIEQTLNRFPAPESVDVTLNLPADLPQIFVDPHHVVQILGNLTVNAYQVVESKGGRVEISVASRADMVSIAVHDNGTGISPENMTKLFEPLFTTKIKGIGLGLAVSKKLTEANGGRIEVNSEAGVGSTFTVWLPVK
jgi:PAS domain S-box-containing protein